MNNVFRVWLESLDRRLLLCGDHVMPIEFATAELEAQPVVNRGAGQVQFVTLFEDTFSQYTAYYDRIDAMVQAAGADWAGLLDASDASIEVVVSFRTDVASAAASSLTTVAIRNEGGFSVRESGMAYELRTGIDPNQLSPDVRILLGTSYLQNTLWFDPDPQSRSIPVGINQTDAYSVFLHELGHGLAYIGWRNWTTGALPANYMSPFDQDIMMQAGQPYHIGAAVQSTYSGPAALTYANMMHWGNAAPRPGTDLIPQLMNGVVFYRGTRYDVGAMDVAVLRDVDLPVDSSPPELAEIQYYFEQTQSVEITFNESVRSSIAGSSIIARHDSLGDFEATWLTYDRATDTATVTFGPGGALPDGDYQVIPNGVTDIAGNAALPSVPAAFFVLSADATRDRTVNLDDFTALAANFGQTGRVFSQGNFNYDAGGAVNLDDFTILASRFGNTLAADVPVARGARPPQLSAPSTSAAGFAARRIGDDVLHTPEQMA